MSKIDLLGKVHHTPLVIYFRTSILPMTKVTNPVYFREEVT